MIVRRVNNETVVMADVKLRRFFVPQPHRQAIGVTTSIRFATVRSSLFGNVVILPIIMKILSNTKKKKLVIHLKFCFLDLTFVI